MTRCFRMPILRPVLIVSLAWLLMPCRFVGAGPQPLPDERDRAVLEAFLLHLAQDSRFDLTAVPPSTNAHIVLHSRSYGIVNWQTNPLNLEGHHVSTDLAQDLKRRNVKTGEHAPQIVPWAGFKWDSRIEVTDLSQIQMP